MRNFLIIGLEFNSDKKPYLLTSLFSPQSLYNSELTVLLFKYFLFTNIASLVNVTFTAYPHCGAIHYPHCIPLITAYHRRCHTPITPRGGT